jgi:hypothetical protein
VLGGPEKYERLPFIFKEFYRYCRAVIIDVVDILDMVTRLTKKKIPYSVSEFKIY